MRRVTFLLAASAALAIRPAAAASWVDTIFPERFHDFGTVARGAKLHHTFRLVNTTGQDVHIADWRTKCGCTEVRVGARDIPPGTQTTIEAVLDTTKFLGPKSSGLTLVIDRPSFIEVELNLSCDIRGDILLSPGQVDFGVVPRNSQPAVTLTLSYNGTMPNWGVLRMQTQSAHVAAKLQETGRSLDGQVQYLLTASLKPTVPNGNFKDEILAFTNDASSPTIPISVTAQVQSAVAVSPSLLNLGHVKPGEVVKRTLLVRSSQPFKLTSVKPSRDDVSATPDLEGARPLHTVAITLTAPRQTGAYIAACEIATDLKDEPPARINIFATVVP